MCTFMGALPFLVKPAAEQLGDPFGTKKEREEKAAESQQNRWAREDQLREASQAHEMALADKGIGKGNWRGGNSNRRGLQAGQSQSNTTTDRAY